MPPLHVALHTLRTEHPAVEGELFPRLKANHLIIANLELYPALLTAKTAMRFHQPLSGGAGFVLPAAWRDVSRVWTKTLQQGFQRNRGLSHELPLSGVVARAI